MRSAVVLAGLLVPSFAAAHAVLTYPPPRDGTVIKDAPCGALNSTRGTNVTTLAPGSTLTIQFKETIDHPGHYRVSFDNDGQDFYMPVDFNTNTEGQLNVIDDLIPDIQGALPAGGRPYTVDITLPNVECTNCTLQLIQMMTESPPFDENDIYFTCADITLAANAPDAGTQVMNPDAGVEDPGGGGPNSGNESGGCSAGGSGAGLGAGFALLGFLGFRRRRLTA